MIASAFHSGQILNQSRRFDVCEFVCATVFFLTVVHQAAPACPRRHVSSNRSPPPRRTTRASLGRESHLPVQRGHPHTVLRRMERVGVGSGTVQLEYIMVISILKTMSSVCDVRINSSF